MFKFAYYPKTTYTTNLQVCVKKDSVTDPKEWNIYIGYGDGSNRPIYLKTCKTEEEAIKEWRRILEKIDNEFRDHEGGTHQKIIDITKLFNL